MGGRVERKRAPLTREKVESEGSEERRGRRRSSSGSDEAVG